MIVAWGLEMGNATKEVRYIIKSLFDENMLGGLESILEWSVPRAGYNFFECFEDEDKGRWFGYITFLRWKARIDKQSLYHEAFVAWERL